LLSLFFGFDGTLTQKLGREKKGKEKKRVLEGNENMNIAIHTSMFAKKPVFYENNPISTLDTQSTHKGTAQCSSLHTFIFICQI